MNFLNLDNLTTFLNKCKQYFAHTVNDVEPVDGNIEITNVDSANNLVSSQDQILQDTFIYRTTGGATSINSGDAQLTSIRGNTIRTGYVAPNWDIKFQDTQGSTLQTDMEATIDEDSWKKQVTEGGTTTFQWDGSSWGETEPSTYGVTISNFDGAERIEIENNTSLVITTNLEDYKSGAGALVSENISYTFQYTFDPENSADTFWTNGSSRVDDLSYYGITITGTPVVNESNFIFNYINGEVPFNLRIVYTKEDLGTLYGTKPLSFISTGFNSFDGVSKIDDAGIILVDDVPTITNENKTGRYICYCRCVGGLTEGYIAYLPGGTIYNIGYTSTIPLVGSTVMLGTLITSEEESTTEKAVITNFLESGYLVVETDENYSNLQIHPRWSGKADEDTATYVSPSIITFPTSGTYNGSSNLLPEWGLFRINNTYDEFNFSQKTYIQRIQRQNITDSLSANITDFIEDSTYRYYVLNEPIEWTLTISDHYGEYIANDYGTEEFTFDSDDQKVPVPCTLLYGQNLIDKLRTDVLTISDQSLTNTQLSQVYTNLQLLNAIYPIGSIYMSINEVSPSTLLGGTWERLQDRFLLGASSTYPANSTGGETTHTLTVNEMPSHNHSFKEQFYFRNTGTAWTIGRLGRDDITGDNVYTIPTYNTGGGQAHNNMPPYLAVYMWKRVS